MTCDMGRRDLVFGESSRCKSEADGVDKLNALLST